MIAWPLSGSVIVKIYQLFSMCLLVLLAGCAGHKNLYYWGEYESVLLDMYTDPGEATNEVQIQRLNESIQSAQDVNMAVPPGLYAHLGMIYARQGNMKAAMQAFEMEKNVFPESALFIDGMVERAKKRVSQ